MANKEYVIFIFSRNNITYKNKPTLETMFNYAKLKGEKWLTPTFKVLNQNVTDAKSTKDTLSHLSHLTQNDNKNQKRNSATPDFTNSKSVVKQTI